MKLAAEKKNAPTESKFSRFDRLCRHLVVRRLAGLRSGRLTIDDDLGRFTFGGATTSNTLSAKVRVHSAAFYRRLAVGGAVGAGESYMQGEWTTNELTQLIRLFVRDIPISTGLGRGIGWAIPSLWHLTHLFRRNTRRRSKENIQAHYDLSNEFFAQLLDPTMTYSCAIFADDNVTLEDAQIEKMDRICCLLELAPEDHLLEIGGGWGSLALHAATKYGCQVTTTTISPAQHEFALQRIQTTGLSDRVSVLRRDYRDLSGCYDKLVSIEMIEAIGAEYFDTYFRTCARLLRPGGRFCMQAIAIADHHFARARASADFIKKWIFPGCCIPSVGAIVGSVTRATPLDLIYANDIGRNYPKTLAHWRRNLREHESDVRALGINERCIRMWEYYLCYCEAGFAEERLRDFQMLFVRPQSA